MFFLEPHLLEVEDYWQQKSSCKESKQFRLRSFVGVPRRSCKCITRVEGEKFWELLCLFLEGKKKKKDNKRLWWGKRFSHMKRTCFWHILYGKCHILDLFQMHTVVDFVYWSCKSFLPHSRKIKLYSFSLLLASFFAEHNGKMHSTLGNEGSNGGRKLIGQSGDKLGLELLLFHSCNSK